MKKLKHYVGTLSEILKSEGKFRTARAYRPAQIRRYERWLVRRQLAMNTVSFYMRNLRAIYNRAVRANIVGKKRENPFSGVYTGVAKTVKRALAEADVKRLSSVASNVSSFHPALPALKQTEAEALLIFHFCLLAQGMSFADAAFLKKKILRDKNIVYRRRKTGKDIIVFYDSDCGNCQNELHKIIGRYNLLKDNRIRVISIAADVNGGLFEETAQKIVWQDNICDFRGFDGENFVNYGVVGTPTLVLIDKDGIVRGRYARIEELLGKN